MLFRAWSLVQRMATKPNVVFILGAPGAGKGTQCKKIVKKFGYEHLSAGDLLREEQSTPGSQYGDLIAGCIENGTIVPVEITCRLIEKAMQKSQSSKFLIDGFPRNKNNLDGWNTCMADKVNVQFVLFIDCSEEACIERCLNRGAKGSGRTDDNKESLIKRFNTYRLETLPIIEELKDKVVLKVDGNQNPEAVFDTVRDMFQQFA